MTKRGEKKWKEEDETRKLIKRKNITTFGIDKITVIQFPLSLSLVRARVRDGYFFTFCKFLFIPFLLFFLTSSSVPISLLLFVPNSFPFLILFYFLFLCSTTSLLLFIFASISFSLRFIFTQFPFYSYAQFSSLSSFLFQSFLVTLLVHIYICTFIVYIFSLHHVI